MVSDGPEKNFVQVYGTESAMAKIPSETAGDVNNRPGAEFRSVRSAALFNLVRGR